MFRRWFLPCWVVGVAVSFALSVVPHWPFWLAAFAVLAVLARRFAFAGLMLCVLAGAAYGVFRTEAALSSQWRAGGFRRAFDGGSDGYAEVGRAARAVCGKGCGQRRSDV